MNRKNGYGEAVLGNWSASDADAAPGMVSLLRPFSMTGLFNDFSTSGAAGGAWRGDAAALAQWGLGRTNPVNGNVYHWNTDNTTTANNCLCADPALDDNNKIKEDVNAAYVQLGLHFDLFDRPSTLLVGVRYEQTTWLQPRTFWCPSSRAEWSGRRTTTSPSRARRRSNRSPKRRTTAMSCRASTST